MSGDRLVEFGPTRVRIADLSLAIAATGMGWDSQPNSALGDGFNLLLLGERHPGVSDGVTSSFKQSSSESLPTQFGG